MRYTKSNKLYAKAVEIIPGGSQTTSKRPSQYAPGAFPVYFTKGKGSKIWDADGNKYTDYILALGPVTLGYCYEPVDSAIREELKNGIIYSLLNELEIRAAEKLIQAIPWAEMVRFFKTGAEATSAAVRVARAYTGRDLILSCAYHGWHDNFTGKSPGVPGAVSGLKLEFNYNDIEQLENILKKYKGKIACIIMEPLSYSEPEKNCFLKNVRKLAEKHGVILILDEIVTGFRLAVGGGPEYFNVIPDMACYAKGMANGMPVAAVTGRKEIMRTMKDLFITSTYGGETLSLAALVASVDVYMKKDVIGHMWKMGRKLMDGLNKAAKSLDISARWAGYDSMSSFTFDYDDKEYSMALMIEFIRECAARGVLFRKGGLNYITYTHTDKDLETSIKAGYESLSVIKDTMRRGRIKYKGISKTIEKGVRKF
jgi:glutamate-1-semialdehyde 2,1-aminomutase